MSSKRLIFRIMSLVLCLCILVQLHPFARATTGQSILYLKDMKLIYAESVKEAEEKLPEGYILYRQDINDGTDSLGVYLCYSTTTEESEAITDVRVMNENGNFNRGAFNEQMDKALEELEEQSAQIYAAIVDEFIPNLNKGIPGAKHAYEQLNVFMFDEENPLGDYIKDGKLTQADVSKMLLVCHNVVLTAVLSLIAQGLQRPDGEDWMDILETMDPADYEMDAALQEEYAELISRFQGPMSAFSDQYNIMVYTDDVRDSMTVEQIALYSEDLADEVTVQWWYNLWDILNAHTLGGDSGFTTEYLFVEWNLGEGVANYKICMLLEALTPGQRALMQLVGPINFILNDVFTEDTRLQAQEDLKDLKEENGTVSLWGGVDTGVFDAEVGITSEAYDEMVTANNYDIFTQENNVLEKTLHDYISIISNYASLVTAGLSVIRGITILAKGFAGISTVARVVAKIGLLITKSLLGSIFFYTSLTVTAVCLLATLILWIVEEIQAGKPPEHDRTTIPKYMIDSVVDSAGAQIYETYQRVDNVQTDSQLKEEDWGLDDVKNMSGADINANKGYHWAAIYVSRSHSVGNPVEAEFAVMEGVDIAPDGFVALRHFNRKSEAVDLNGVDEYNASDPNLYLYYKGQKLSEEHRVYKYVRQIQAVSVSLRDPSNPDKYRFSTEEAIAVARKQLSGASPTYYVMDHNFSQDPDVVTLLGWNGTNRESDAIRDIRLVHTSSVGRAGAGTFGGLTYANMGQIDQWSLFVCRMDGMDIPPVTMLKLVNHGEDPSQVKGIPINMEEKDSYLGTDGEVDYSTGWEAVNEFSGGGAIPLSEQGVQLYFMPKTTFTEGPDYLAGIEIDAYIANNGFIEGAKNCCHVDIWDNSYENYRAFKEEKCGEHFFDFSIYTQGDFESAASLSSEIHGYTADNPDCPLIGKNADELLPAQTTSSVKYNLTKNPYRAIYGLAMRNSNDETLRASFINYDGYGYALCPVEITSSMCGSTFELFGYHKNLENGKKLWGKTFVVEDREHHSDGIVVNQDITQVIWPVEDVGLNNLYMSGYSLDRKPLTVEDVCFSERPLEESDYPENFIGIPYMGGDGTEVNSIAPFSQKVRVSVWDFSTVIHVDLFKDFYGYFRSQVGIKEEEITTYNPGQGQYVENLLLASKEKIRTSSLLPNDKDAECKDISYKQLEIQLVNMGATTTYDTNIGTDYYEDGNDNANTVYLGLTRTDDADNAIRDIRFVVCGPGERPKKTIQAQVEVNGKTHKVEYTLVSDISFTSKANLDCERVVNNKGMEVLEEKELLEERQAYLYICRNKTAFPDPITDIQITQWCSFGTFEPVLSLKGETIYTVKKQSSVNLHVKNAWFESGNFFSFKREGNNDRYVSELAIRNGGDENKVRSALIEAGYSVVNKDMNEKAAGDHIYIGCKFTDDKSEAITNLMTIHSAAKYNSYAVTDEEHIYQIVADVDLNKGAAGDYIYLYYTKDARAGAPICELYGSGSVKEHTDTLYNHQTVRRLWDFKHSNLNAGTTVFTANIYLVMKREGNTGKYISDVMVAYGWSKSGALEKLREKGFTEYVDKDLNDGTGSSQWIYLGYKRTDDPEKALRNLLIFKTTANKTNTVNGSKYTLVSDVNLNRHCTIYSDDLFLYYTKDPAAGDPITELYCSSKPVEYHKDEKGYHATVRLGSGYNYGNAYVDLNSWANGDYIYLVMVSTPLSSQNSGGNTGTGSTETVYTLTLNTGTTQQLTYKEGDTVTVSVEEELLDRFSHWEATGIELDNQTSLGSTLTFTMPAKNVELTAVFTQQLYLVTLPNGAVFTDGSTTGRYAQGDSVQVYWQDPLLHLNKWVLADGIQVSSVWDNPMTFVMPDKDVYIDVNTFAKTTAAELTVQALADSQSLTAGQTLPTAAVYTANGQEYTAQIRWYLAETEVFKAQAGQTYRAVITLMDDGGNKVVFGETGTATLAGLAVESWERIENGVRLTVSLSCPPAAVEEVNEGANGGTDNENLAATLLGGGSWIAIAVLSLGLVGIGLVLVLLRGKSGKHRRRR